MVSTAVIHYYLNIKEHFFSGLQCSCLQFFLNDLSVIPIAMMYVSVSEVVQVNNEYKAEGNTILMGFSKV